VALLSTLGAENMNTIRLRLGLSWMAILTIFGFLYFNCVFGDLAALIFICFRHRLEVPRKDTFLVKKSIQLGYNIAFIVFFILAIIDKSHPFPAWTGTIGKIFGALLFLPPIAFRGYEDYILFMASSNTQVTGANHRWR
jgi:hypothetical protein